MKKETYYKASALLSEIDVYKKELDRVKIAQNDDVEHVRANFHSENMMQNVSIPVDLFKPICKEAEHRLSQKIDDLEKQFNEL